MLIILSYTEKFQTELKIVFRFNYLNYDESNISLRTNRWGKVYVYSFITFTNYWQGETTLERWKQIINQNTT